MSTFSNVVAHLGEHLAGFVCDIRGHDWAGARQHAAQSDGLLLCVRCGYESEGRSPKRTRQLVDLHEA
jgi:hypothetical protein